MWNYIKRKIGLGGADKDVPASEQFYSPLRIALHSTIGLDTVDWIVVQQDLSPNFSVPVGKMEVLAIGQTEQGIYRFYLQDEKSTEFVLQVLCDKDHRTGDEKVSEIMLFKQVSSHYPSSDEAWSEYIKDFGLKTFILDDITYDRVWGDEMSEVAEPIKFDEHIIAPQEEYDYEDSYMLYVREIGGQDISEFALIGIEESSDSAEVVTHIGLTVYPSNVTVQ